MNAALALLRWGFLGIALLATAYVVLHHLLGLAMLLAAAWEMRRQSRLRAFESPEAAVDSGELPGVSVLIPAFNEVAAIVRTVESILALHYRDLEVVVVSDGSTDGTIDSLASRFRLRLASDPPSEAIPTQGVRALFRSQADPRLLVLDKRNGGKADALNVGINYAAKPLVAVVDADVVLDPWSLAQLAQPFAEDPATVATSGTIRLQNGCRIQGGRVLENGLPGSTLERIQVVEYIRAFSLGRLFFNVVDAHVLISGAFGLFRRSVLAQIGGFQPNAIGEDMELVLRMHRHLQRSGVPYRIHFVADAVCYTEAPGSLADLGKQRTRWHQGLLTSLRLHRAVFFARRTGAVGWLALPYFALFELLSPVAEAAGWVLIPVGVLAGLLPPAQFAAFFAASLLLGSTVSFVAVFLDDAMLGFLPRFRDVLGLCWYALVEHFGYHQATVYFRLRAFARFYGGIHLRGGWVSPSRQARPRT